MLFIVPVFCLQLTTQSQEWNSSGILHWEHHLGTKECGILEQFGFHTMKGQLVEAHWLSCDLVHFRESPSPV